MNSRRPNLALQDSDLGITEVLALPQEEGPLDVESFVMLRLVDLEVVVQVPPVLDDTDRVEERGKEEHGSTSQEQDHHPSITARPAWDSHHLARGATTTAGRAPEPWWKGRSGALTPHDGEGLFDGAVPEFDHGAVFLLQHEALEAILEWPMEERLPPPKIEGHRQRNLEVPAVEVLERILSIVPTDYLRGIRKIVLCDRDYHDRRRKAAGRYVALKGTRVADIELLLAGR